MYKKILTIVLALTTSNLYAWEQDKTYHFTILHTNDHHGRFWHNDIGEYGLAAQKTLVDQIRQQRQAEGASVLLLSGGDINTGVPESDLLDAEPDFKGMNLVGYDAMAVGNHEFDNAPEVLKLQQQWANFPFLSANIYEKGTNNRPFKAYEIFERQGLKIAVIGLTTDDTPRLSDSKNTAHLEFRPPAEEAKRVIESLQANEKPDVIIAATHMGHYDDGKHGSNTPGDVEMARALPAGYLDMIVGGHSQDPVCMASENVKHANYVPGTPCQPDQQNGTWIVQAHEWGKYVGRADFSFKNGELTLTHYELIPVNLMKEVAKEDGTKTLAYYTEKITPDTEVVELLTPYQEKGQQQLSEKIGSINGRLEGERSKVRFEQTNLARMLLEAFIQRTNADFSVAGGGTIRDSMLPGDLTYKDVLKVLPFGNTLTYVDLTGKEVEAYLAVVANKVKRSGGYAQFANVSLVADGKGVTKVKIKGKALDANKTYRLALLSFFASGGDGYPKVDEHPNYVDTGFVDAEVLKQYIVDHSPIDVNVFTPKNEIRYTHQ